MSPKIMKVQVARSTAERGALIMRGACALERATILSQRCLSLSLCISPLKTSASAKTYLPWSDSCKSGTMLCVVATWSRHARLHIKRRSSSSRRQTEPTHSKRGRNGRRTPGRPQKTDDRTHLHACPVCRVSLSRATPAPSSIVSYDE